MRVRDEDVKRLSHQFQHHGLSYYPELIISSGGIRENQDRKHVEAWVKKIHEIVHTIVFKEYGAGFE